MILHVRWRTTPGDHLSLAHTIEEGTLEESSKSNIK